MPDAPIPETSRVPLDGDFTNLWSGQAASLARKTTAAELARRLATEALE